MPAEGSREEEGCQAEGAAQALKSACFFLGVSRGGIGVGAPPDRSWGRWCVQWLRAPCKTLHGPSKSRPFPRAACKPEARLEAPSRPRDADSRGRGVWAGGSGAMGHQRATHTPRGSHLAAPSPVPMETAYAARTAPGATRRGRKRRIERLPASGSSAFLRPPLLPSPRPALYGQARSARSARAQRDGASAPGFCWLFCCLDCREGAVPLQSRSPLHPGHRTWELST